MNDGVLSWVKDIPSILYHPSHLLGRALASGEDQVAFVLSILVVHDHEELAPGKRRERILYWIELESSPL